MRKKDLMRDLAIANARIESLEDIICPARQHKWFNDYENECRICLKCRKVVCGWMTDEAKRLEQSAEYHQVLSRYDDFIGRIGGCDDCPFHEEECDGNKRCFNGDILALLIRGKEHEKEVFALREELERVTKERDAAVEDLSVFGESCYACVHKRADAACRECRFEMTDKHHLTRTNWQWRGVKE